MQFISSIFQHFHQPNGAKKECPWKHIDEPNAEQTYNQNSKKFVKHQSFRVFDFREISFYL